MLLGVKAYNINALHQLTGGTILWHRRTAENSMDLGSRCLTPDAHRPSAYERHFRETNADPASVYTIHGTGSFLLPQQYQKMSSWGSWASIWADQPPGSFTEYDLPPEEFVN